MSIKVSGGGGGGGYPGVTGDGLTPPGLIVAGGFQAGDATRTDFPDTFTFNGAMALLDDDANTFDGDGPFRIHQQAAVPLGGFGESAAYITRTGDISAKDYSRPAWRVADTTASTQPVMRAEKQGTTVLEITTRKSIAGALAAVTDANAKDVLTSIIAALTGIKVADDNTT